MIKVRANNKIYTNFKKVEVTIDMDNLCGSFSFVSSISKDNLYPLKMNDYIEIDVDGSQIINGFIDKLHLLTSSTSHDIRVGGYSVIADILNSAVLYSTADVKEFNGPITLENIARLLLDANGMESTKVINKAGEIGIFTENDIESGNIGETIFEFLENLSRKRQIILNSDECGNLVLSRGLGEYSTKISNTLINKIQNDENNIISASLNLNNSDRYWEYIVHSTLNPITLTRRIGSIVDEVGSIIDSDIRTTRKFEMKAEENIDKSYCKERAKWEKNIRKVRSFNYSAVVQGHSVDNIPYRINTLTNVIDEFCNINESLLIKNVVFNYSIENGSTTNLGCVLKDAYTTAPLEVKGSEVASSFVSEVSIEELKSKKAKNTPYGDFDEVNR